MGEGKRKKSLYSKVQFFDYKDGTFGVGLVKYSKHPVNKVYLQINDYVFELRSDEAHAILASLSHALWCDELTTLKQKNKLKWISRKKLMK